MSLALLWVVMSFQQVSAGGLNLPAGSNGGRICKVTSMVDDVKVVGSLRRAMVSGYNVQDSALPSFCTEKIVFDAPGTITLRDSIELNNKAASGFTLEKATGVTGEVILDATGVGDGKCAIVVDSNQVTIRGISIRNASGPGICIKSGSNQNLLENVRVANSADGVLVESGSIDNVIQQGEFFNNRGFGVNLQGAEQNLVTKNSIHGNGAGPISSPAGDLRPTIASAAPSNSAATTWVLSGSVPTSVHHIEVYRGVPSVNNTTYITDILELSGLSFVATIEASSGEQIWAIGIGADNTTSPSSEITTLSVVGGVGGNPGSGPRACFPGQVFTPTQDFDRDGIFDVNEDKNANCNVDTGETDPEKDDTDGDTISDGLEDFNKNGVIDDGESDPANTDTDGDGLEDGPPTNLIPPTPTPTMTAFPIILKISTATESTTAISRPMDLKTAVSTRTGMVLKTAKRTLISTEFTTPFERATHGYGIRTATIYWTLMTIVRIILPPVVPRLASPESSRMKASITTTTVCRISSRIWTAIVKRTWEKPTPSIKTPTMTAETITSTLVRTIPILPAKGFAIRKTSIPSWTRTATA
jgi:hypothetical protein